MGSGPHAEVKILAMQEIAFVHEPEVVNGITFDEHAGAGDGLNLDRCLRERLAVQMEIIEQLRPAA